MIRCEDCSGETNQCIECAAAEDAEEWYTAMEIIESRMVRK